MTKITFVLANASKHEVDVEPGLSLMEAAVQNGIDGIVAECGGACACATCHCYIDNQWKNKLQPMDDMEDCMLDAAIGRRPGSRLACQIEVTAALEGLTVRVAENND